MRIVSLVALALILPAIAYAALININTANATLLDTLLGIGPSKAAAIIDYRTKHGAFTKIEDIQNVSGIGPVTFANMKDKITVEGIATPAPAPQPSPAPVSYKKVQVVEPIISAQENIQTHEEAMIAPTAAVEPAAVGAMSPIERSRASGLFHSVWTFGLLVVIAVAGWAFVFL